MLCEKKVHLVTDGTADQEDEILNTAVRKGKMHNRFEI